MGEVKRKLNFVAIIQKSQARYTRLSERHQGLEEKTERRTQDTKSERCCLICGQSLSVRGRKMDVRKNHVTLQ